MTVSVAIAGATGYAGGELVRLLLGHPEHLAGNLQIGALTGASSAGTPVSEALPHAPELFGRTIEPTDAEHLAGHDVVFLALPHGHSAEIAAQLPEDTVVIDCAADHRLTDAGDWAHWYGGDYSGSWPYGIPEMPGHREELAGATRIALPGCFPTGATLALLPAVAAGLVAPEVTVTSVSGVSGAGKKPVVTNLGAETMGSLRAYNTAGRHRHTPEIAQNLGEYSEEPVSVSFTPVLAPLPRGILTVASAPLAEAAAGTDTAAARAVYEEFYADEPFVTLLAEGVQPQTQWVLGANTCHVQVEVDAASGRLLATAAIDNLTKGTAGAGVQCMNLALGLPETAGLPTTAVAP